MSQFCALVHVPELDVGPHAITPKTKDMISVRIVEAPLLNAAFSAIYET
jgi:hypothetical protein